MASSLLDFVLCESSESGAIKGTVRPLLKVSIWSCTHNRPSLSVVWERRSRNKLVCLTGKGSSDESTRKMATCKTRRSCSREARKWRVRVCLLEAKVNRCLSMTSRGHLDHVQRPKQVRVDGRRKMSNLFKEQH
jgi:hypothetical protein